MFLLKLKNTKGMMSLLLIAEGVLFLFCIPVAVANHEPLRMFIISFLLSLFAGVLMFFISSGKSGKTEQNRKNIVLLVLTWFVAVIVGTFPFFAGKSTGPFSDILFETVSGLTSTGTSVLPNPEILPRSVLFWRSLSQWYGGILTLTMLLVIFPDINIGGYKIFSFGGRKLRVVTRVLAVYCMLTFLQVFLLSAGGTGLFKSFCISFATLSTGSFLPDKTAVSGYAPYIQLVMAFFMFLSGFGGLLFYTFSVPGKTGFRKNDETRLYLVFFLIVTILIFFILNLQGDHNPGRIARESIFQSASFLSSSGYGITDYSIWPHYFLPFLYLLIVIGGCTNSVSGGIKMSRFLILFRNIKKQFKNPLNDSNVSEITFNKSRIDEEANLNVLAFAAIFGLILILGTLVLSFSTNDIKKAVFLAVTALSTFGHNLDLSGLPWPGKFTLSVLMLAGRLEIFPLLVFFISSFYKNSPADKEKQNKQ